MDNRVFLFIYVALAFICSGIHVAYISRRDTYAMEKYVKVTAIWAYFLAAILYLIALFYFYTDKTYIQQAILGVAMIVCFPAALVTLSVALITGSNV